LGGKISQTLPGRELWFCVSGAVITTTTIVPPPETYDVWNNRWIPLDNPFNLSTLLRRRRSTSLCPLQAGPATIAVGNPVSTFSASMVQIVPAAPAPFTKDQRGRDEAIPVATLDDTRFQTAPFNALVNGRSNNLVLFGTGLRRADATNPNNDDGVTEAVSVTAGSRSARVHFAGAQGGFIGLIQINVEMPTSLAGNVPRNVKAALAVNRVKANHVLIEVK
jgi:uncharacterized protein (TIGR03437 family)